MYQLIAFDAYGTLFDVYSIGALADELFPGFGHALAQMWRDRQIEYTRLVTMSDAQPGGSRHYLPFEELTVRALRYVCKRMQLPLSADREARLMAQYARLTPFPDSLSVLQAVRSRGLHTAILSNGNAAALSALTVNTGLASAIDQVISVDPVRLFKTAPQTYQLLLESFGLARKDILFVSSNAWDALGATWFGLDVFWVNRMGHPFEEIGMPPRYEGTALSGLLPLLDRPVQSR